MIYRVMAFVVIAYAVLGVGSNATADLSLDNMISGTGVGAGEETIHLYTVPDGFRFVLTDLSWSDYNPGSFIVTLLEDINPRWCWEILYDSNQIIDSHWSTGLVFESGMQINIQVDAYQPFVHDWRASWSGYLRPTAPTDVGESIHPLPDQQILTSPNPSGNLSNLEFSLGQSDHVIVAVFDVQGRKVRTLHEGQLPQGIYSMPWDGMDDQGNSVSDGIYFARVETAEKTRVSKLTRVQ